jgi:NAD(P)-dependent dehydrogenase (short-subunit alcohol dehydrogenase family)
VLGNFRATWHAPQVTSSPTVAQHLHDLALLRRVRDRIDREYAQPLDVEADRSGAWRRTLDLNVNGTMCLVKHAAREMVRGSGGSFVAVSSIAASNTHRWFGGLPVPTVGRRGRGTRSRPAQHDAGT